MPLQKLGVKGWEAMTGDPSLAGGSRLGKDGGNAGHSGPPCSRHGVGRNLRHNIAGQVLHKRREESLSVKSSRPPGGSLAS